MIGEGLLISTPVLWCHDNSSTDTSSTTLRIQTSTSVGLSVSIRANQQRPISYSFAKACYIFSGIQLLITEKIIFINPASIEWKLSFIHASSLVSSFFYRENYFDQSSFYFNTGMFSSTPLPFRDTVFFINPASILK